MKKDDPFKALHDSIHGNNNFFRIMEMSIPLAVQTAYFKLSNKLRSEDQPFDFDDWKKRLLDESTGTEEKKKLLILLSGSKEIVALRLLEEYSKSVPDELKYWCSIALLEAQVQIESDILGEKPVIIATGLGGKEDKLRFFIVFATNNDVPFSPYQENLLEHELSFFAKKYNCEIEEIRIHSNFATVLTLVPLDIEKPGRLFDRVIQECNAYGDFLRNDYVLTNVRILSDNEIKRNLRKASHS
ncbi:MAG: hypothetical protein PUB21_02570 [Bacteroidales bacterium]|nr:hypothetical protein [Bacteroidales bacterium]